MTQETKTLISPTDVIAIHYICGKCGSVLSVPIANEHSVHGSCKMCKSDWFQDVDARKDHIYDMVSAIRSVQRTIASEGVGAPLSVMLEIGLKP